MWQLDKLSSNSAQQLAGRVANALAVREVTGILIRDATWHFGLRHPEAQLSEKLGYVFHFCGEVVSAVAVFGIGLQQVAIFFHRGATPGCVGNDCVEALVEHGIDVAPRQIASIVAQARMGVQRTTTALSFRDADFNSIALQNANGSAIELGE